MARSNQSESLQIDQLGQPLRPGDPRIAILGISGFAKEVYSVLHTLNYDISRVGFIDKSQESLLQAGDIAFLGMGSPSIRSSCFSTNESMCIFPQLIHPNSSIGKDVLIGSGTFIQSGAVITTQIEIGRGCLININSTIGHDSVIGDFTVVNPGATVSGNVVIGKAVLLGANATILENISIGDGAKIGAGAVVTRNVKDGETVIGVPARPI